MDLKDALCGVHTTVTTLDNRQLKIDALNVNPDTIKILPGEGMLSSKVSSIVSVQHTISSLLVISNFFIKYMQLLIIFFSASISETEEGRSSREV